MAKDEEELRTLAKDAGLSAADTQKLVDANIRKQAKPTKGHGAPPQKFAPIADF